MEHDCYSSAVWNDSKCSKVFFFPGVGMFRAFKCFITSHCSSLPQSLYDKTHTHTSERAAGVQLYSDRFMFFIRIWLRAAQEHNSTDPTVFDSERIMDLKYQAALTNTHKTECLQGCFTGVLTLSVFTRKFFEWKTNGNYLVMNVWMFVMLDPYRYYRVT